MSDTPTPRTDAEGGWDLLVVGQVVRADFARQLERELAAVTAERDDALKALQTQKHLSRGELDALRAENERLRELLLEIEDEVPAALRRWEEMG